MSHLSRLSSRIARAVLLGALLALLAAAPPARVGAQDDEYVIGIDDVLHVQVWDAKELEQTMPVRPDGKISFPLVGEVRASGLTASQLTDVLTERLSRSVKNPNVSVVVKEIRSLRVFFVGQFARPGVYPIRPGTPVLQALTLAGGLAPGADLSAAYVVRDNQRIAVDLRRLVQDADLSQNVPLRTDDTVVVPDLVAGANPQELSERRIYVLGRVQRPGVYTIRQEVPILHAIFLAGGFVDAVPPARPAAGGASAAAAPAEGDRGDLSNAFVIRGKERIPVDLRRLIQKGDLSQNVMIRHEDTIVVPDGGDLQNAVFIMGEIARPGSYPRAEAMSLLKLVSLAGGFTRFAAPGRITILRENGHQEADGSGRQKQRLRIDADGIARNPKENPDPTLQAGDVVVVPQTLF
jgi:polysaccharide export outer membrane protein